MQNRIQGIGCSSLQKNEVCTVRIRPHEQVKVLLGDFAKDEIPKGFCIEVTSPVGVDDSITSQVVSVCNGSRVRFFMHIANYSDKTAEVEAKCASLSAH
ncbi:MAG TPA: hypothetical protein VFT16_00100 [Candidatus Saccharimonadales bacterium]|nr:hypothetical protein [Candidatus Saccharimonadales bacterium]